MVGMLVIGLVAGVVVGMAVGVAAARRARGPVIDEAVDRALATLRGQATAERDQAVHAALQQMAVLQHEIMGAQLEAGRADLASEKGLIDARLDQVEKGLRVGLDRLGDAVAQLGRHHAAGTEGVKATLAAHAEATAALSRTTQGLHQALASPKARGQWGERMAEDVLRMAGFVEHVNYEKQTAVDGGRAMPDFTFPLPKGHTLYMDVKFPLSAYLRYLEARTDAERSAHREAFLRDVRARVKELAGRDYARAGSVRSVDYVLLFLPNEAISAFIHDHDASIVDDALVQRVVLCSPLTLFAMLGVIRQAFDNFMIEQTSDEILRVLGTFDVQWQKFAAALDGLGRKLDTAQRAYDEVAGARRRQLERPLARLEELRNERGLAAAEPAPDDGAAVLELGA
jgi:DNA recombination protein RmuC